MSMSSNERGLLVGSLKSYWSEQLEAARMAKKPFSDIGEICYSFYRQATNFMWEDEFKERFLKSVEKPKFCVTLQKAFEYVAVIGPYLMWQNPHRQIEPRLIEEYPLELIFSEADMQDPMSQGLMQSVVKETKLANLRREARASLGQTYLNYSSNEQPGGLFGACQSAVVDAMIHGRGCLWPSKLNFHGDSRTLTQLEYSSVSNLLIDPDCNDPLLRTAKWVARRHFTHYHELERRFKLKKGALRNGGSIESTAHRLADRHAKRGPTLRGVKEARGEHNDIVEWYEIFSKMGAGTRDSGYESFVNYDFDGNVGDFTYLAISPTVDFPLNLPASVMRKSKDEIFDAMMWPCPSFADNRFPVALLDFYPDPKGCWPIAPLGPALGELIAMNIILSAFIENAYENRKQIVGIAKDAVEEFEKALRSTKSTEYVMVDRQLHGSLNEVITVLNRPEMNMDPLAALEWLGDSFARRTGLTDFQYAMTTTQSRSAADISAKEEKSSIRPDKMSKDVAAFVSEASRLEFFLASLVVTGESLTTLLGPVGATLWNELIAEYDTVELAREMDVRVEASDIRRPNRARDAQNMQSATGVLMPMYQAYASVTGDPVPLNEFVAKFFEAMEMKAPRQEMGSWVPEPSPEQVQMQQQAAQLEMADQQAETEKTQAETAKIMAELQTMQSGAQGEMQKKQLELQFEQAKTASKIQSDQAKTANDIQMNQAKTQAEIASNFAKAQAESQVKNAQHGQKFTQDQIEFLQKRHQDQVSFDQSMAQFKQESAARERRKRAGVK